MSSSHASLDTLLSAGCETEQATKVCRSRGGESCAFDGAMIVLQPIADAAHVVHGPIACVGNSWETRGVRSSAGNLHTRGFTTDLSEMDIIYGGEDKLLEAIVEIATVERPSAVFVYSTCVTGLTGEDIDTVAHTAAERVGIPVIPVHAPGFVGPKNLGNRIAGEALLEHVIGTAEPDLSTATDIALIGEYNVAGDQDLLEPLLAEAGIRILSRITGNATFHEIRYAHRARANVVVCSRALINIPIALQREYGTPYVEASFFGPTQIARSLRSIAEALEAASPEAVGVAARVEAVIARREAWLAEALVPYQHLRGKRAVLYSGGVKSWSMVSTLRDLGIEVIGVGTKKATHEDEAKLALIAPDVPVYEAISPAIIRRLMNQENGDMLVAGGRNQYLAAKEGWPFVDVNQERDAAYAGYEGVVNLAADLSTSVRFYQRQSATHAVPVPQVECPSRAVSIDPLKNAPSLGACFALQGIHRSIPLLHGAQGCSFLSKVAIVKHFREPAALSTTKLFTEEIVMGSDEALTRSIESLVSASSPELIAVVTTAAVEVKGDDVGVTVRSVSPAQPCEIVTVNAPDYAGGFEDGYLSAVRALVSLAVPGPVDSHQVTVLAGSHLTPGDMNELRDLCESFGLFPIMVPDLGSMDGRRQGLSPLAIGGTSVSELRDVGRSAHTLVLGASLQPAAQDLAKVAGTPYTVMESLSGLQAGDRLIETLSLLSGESAPPCLTRARNVLVDVMRDAHLVFGGVHATIALEADHALAVATVLDEMGARPQCVIVPTRTCITASIPADRVLVGDFSDVPDSTDLLVSNAHGGRVAERIGSDHILAGFPVFERFGFTRRMSVGYRGTTEMIERIADRLIQARHSGRATMKGGGQ